MKHLETQLQISFFEWLQLQHPKTAKYCFCIPNGGYYLPRKQNPDGTWYCPSGVKLKKMGLKEGVADVFLMIPNADFCGLFLEFKAPKGKQTPAQSEFEDLCIQMCYDYQIAYSLEDAQLILKQHMSRPCLTFPTS
jgi:hypothetical protein